MRMTNFRLQNSADVEGFEPEDDQEEINNNSQGDIFV